MKREKTRVLIVAAGPPLVGGQSVQAKTLLDGLPESGEIETGFQPVNPVFLPFLQHIKYVKTLVTFCGLVFGLLFKVPRYDIVHVFSASYFSFLIGPLPAIVIGRLFGKPILLNYHSGFLREHFDKWPWSTKIFFAECEEIVAPSGFLVEIFEEFGFRAEVISNSVDVSLFSFRERDSFEPRFLSNRNFEDLYNVQCTIRAFGLIKKEFPKATLKIAGSGPLESELKDLVRKLEIDSVEFVGKVDQTEMARLYEQSDIYLNTPDIDNMPVSVLEAFAAGTVVISTNVGGIPFIVSDQETGMLVDKNDEVGVFEAVRKVLGDAPRARKISLAARKETKKYLWENIAPRWVRKYKEMSN